MGLKLVAPMDGDDPVGDVEILATLKPGYHPKLPQQRQHRLRLAQLLPQQVING
jgi:hypothetical protein